MANFEIKDGVAIIPEGTGGDLQSRLNQYPLTHQ